MHRSTILLALALCAAVLTGCASKGTDHGRGAPAFLLGTPVRGGLHGTPPDLERLIDGDIRQTTDFRAVYTMLETTWMGLPPSTARHLEASIPSEMRRNVSIVR